MDITEFREKYPKYSNMSDQQIAAKLYDRYYSKSMSRQEFYQSFGVPYVGSITEFRKAFPKYSNMSDQQIAAKLYKRYYSNDMSRSEFHKLFGVPYESVSDKIKKFIDRGVEASGKESEMMSSPLVPKVAEKMIRGGVAFVPEGIIKAVTLGEPDGVSDFGKKLSEEVSRKVAGEPQTLEESVVEETLAAPFEKWSGGVQKAADYVYKKTKSPALATGVRVAGESVPYLLPFAGRGAKITAKAAKGALIPPDMTMDLSGSASTTLTPEVPRSLRVHPEYVRKAFSEQAAPSLPPGQGFELQPYPELPIVADSGNPFSSKLHAIDHARRNGFNMNDIDVVPVSGAFDGFGYFVKKTGQDVAPHLTKETQKLTSNEQRPASRASRSVETLQGDKIVDSVDYGNVLEKPGSIKASPALAEQPKTAGEIKEPIHQPSGANQTLESRVYKRLQEEYPNLLDDKVLYTPTTLIKESQTAVDLIDKDYKKAFRIAMNLESSPDVTSTAVNIAMAERARLDGNKTLYSQLVKRRSLDQTRRGQEIVAEKLSVTNNAPERYIKMLVQSRLETIGEKISGLRGATKSKKGRALERIDAEVEKIKHATKEKWMDIADAQKLLDSLACS